MAVQLRAQTEAGATLVAVAERLACTLAERAGVHDRDGSYPHEGIAALRAAGVFAAPIPVELGGSGVTSVHDQVVASSRLARGDASVAIGVNMHLAVLGNMVRRHAVATAAQDTRRQALGEALLRGLARDGTIIAAAVSEPGQVLTRPTTRATRAGTGWRLDGRKIFCTMSPAADVLMTAVSQPGKNGGGDRYAFASVPASAPGLTVHDDWDALGMRASGSGSVTLDGVLVPASAVSGGFPAGDPVPYMARNLSAGLFHAAAALGIAESSADAAQEAVRRRGGGPGLRVAIAQSVVDLAAARATLARSAALIDAAHRAFPAAALPDDEVVALFAETQAAKAFVNDAAGRIVDRALVCSGGSGYLGGHPLGRAYRDVKAGIFMHPLGANRAYDLLSQLALEGDPALG